MIARLAVYLGAVLASIIILFGSAALVGLWLRVMLDVAGL